MVMTEERKTMLRMLLEQEMRQITERAQSDLRPVREAYSQKTGDLADRASHEDGVSIQATILNMKGTGVEFVLPKEGGIAGLAWLAITKGANTELALEYLNQGLDPESQRLIAGAPSYIGPVIEGVQVASELRGIVPATPADLERLKTLDWPKINQHRADWIARWNREIKV